MAPFLRVALRRSSVVVTALVAAIAAGCGSGDDLEAAPPPLTALEQALRRLPDDVPLRRSILFADLARLRSAWPSAAGFEAALVGVWLPDALAELGHPPRVTRFGLRLTDVSVVVAAGFHPAQVAAVTGRFDVAAIRAGLVRSGYARRGGLAVKNDEGGIDVTTPEGRLVLGSLNRVASRPGLLVAGSTTALVVRAGGPERMADVPAVAVAARALGDVTAAAVLDPTIVRPPAGVPSEIVPRHVAERVAIGIRDRPPPGRVVRIVLVYAEVNDAREDAQVVRSWLGRAGPGTRRLPTPAGEGWRVEQAGRAVVLEAAPAAGTDAGAWRSAVERGDLAQLVRHVP